MTPRQMMATYPINAVRNMATLLARTELVLPLDADFLVSSDLNDIVRDPRRCGWLRHWARPKLGRVRLTIRVYPEDQASVYTLAASSMLILSAATSVTSCATPPGELGAKCACRVHCEPNGVMPLLADPLASTCAIPLWSLKLAARARCWQNFACPDADPDLDPDPVPEFESDVPVTNCTPWRTPA